jgi:hypothetical protein
VSFDPSLPAVRDRLRLQLGDTSGDEATELLLDDIYDAVYAYNGNSEPKTLVALAESLIAKFSQAASRINLGDMEFSWRDRMIAWKAILVKFEGISTGDGGGGFVIRRPERDEDSSEYRRPFMMEPWWT